MTQFLEKNVHPNKLKNLTSGIVANQTKFIEEAKKREM